MESLSEFEPSSIKQHEYYLYSVEEYSSIVY